MFSNSILLHASVIDVTGFGACGDGVTDDHAAIQNAVAELKKHNGGILYFPVGQYRIATSGHAHFFWTVFPMQPSVLNPEPSC